MLRKKKILYSAYSIWSHAQIGQNSVSRLGENFHRLTERFTANQMPHEFHNRIANLPTNYYYYCFVNFPDRAHRRQQEQWHCTNFHVGDYFFYIISTILSIDCN